MDPRSRWLLVFLSVVNAILIVFMASMVTNLRAEVRLLRGELATKQDLAAAQTDASQLSYYQKACTRCHTERRFTGVHGTSDDIARIIKRMHSLPDARITESEAERIHASLLLLKCTQCHDRDRLKKLSLMSSEERLSLIRQMARKPGSGISLAETEDIRRAFELLLGF